MIDQPTATDGTLLALDGDFPPTPLILELRNRSRALVAADGAALRLLDLGIVPDVAIGDMDTTGRRREELTRAGTLVIELESQESGDFEKALRWCVDRGETEVTVIGASGGEFDHALNNVSVLLRFSGMLRLRLVDGRSTAVLATDSARIATTQGDKVSIIPLPSAVLTTEGLQWGLNRERLEMGLREGCSNRATGPQVTVTIHEGAALLFHYPGG